MTRTSTRTIVALIALLSAVLVGGLLIIADFGESAGPEDGVTLQDVADRPSAYAGEPVTISGEVRAAAPFSLADADIAFAIGDDTDETVLVYPQRGATLPVGFGSDSVVRVRGVVRVIAPDARTDGGVVGQARALAEDDAQAVVEAVEITVPGGDLGDAANTPAARRALVGQLVRDPRAWDDAPLRVSGTAHRIGAGGFVIADGDASIFVGAPTTDLSGIREGQAVEIRAELERLSRFRANTIPEALAGTPQAPQAGGIDLDLTPTAEGRPFLVMRGLVSTGAAPAQDPRAEGG